jgi:hypothetical protein
MIKVMKEEGLREALFGLGLNKGLTNINIEFTEELYSKMYEVAFKLAGKGGGHDKFLESIQVWVYIEAPRAIWQEYDTYRVGTSKQSESTMHTLNKTEIKEDLFQELEIQENKDDFMQILEIFKRIHSRGNLHDTKMALPEGFLQGRVVNTNYKTIQNIYRQRKNHRMKWWKENLEKLLNQLKNPEFIIK